MKKADQDDRPDWRDTRSEQNDQKAEQRAAGEQAEQAGRRDFLHDGGAGKTSDHEASQVRLQVVSRRFFMSAGQGELGESDDEAGYTNLRADVEELRDHALDQVRKGESAAELRVRVLEAIRAGFANLGQFRQEDEQRNEQEDAGDYEIRSLHHVGFGHSIGQQLRRVSSRPVRRECARCRRE